MDMIYAAFPAVFIVGFAIGMIARGGRKIRCHEQIHRMQARYDEGISEAIVQMILSHQLDLPWINDRQDLMQLARQKKYVHDICIDCGHVVERLVPDRLDLDNVSA